MVWGCMSAKGVGNLHFVDGIVNTDKYIGILQDHLLPSIPRLQTSYGEYTFQQDAAACHTSRKSKSWIATNNIPILDWPSSNPDLSPIETLWGRMKKELRKSPARTKPELKDKLSAIWNSFTPEFCQTLVNSMPKRILEVIASKGDATKY